MASTNSTQQRTVGVNGGATVGQAPPRPNGPFAGVGNLFGALLGQFRPPKVDPFTEAGRMGTAVWGGYVENIEKDRRLSFQQRYKTASDILANVSIVAAGLRFFLNLVAVPAWSVQPAEDLGPGKSSDQAKILAEFAQDIIDDLDTSWSRIVRRSGMYKFHGFGIQEWVARRREDGHIGIADVEQRPQHTIERWELADDGTIVGMWQRWPQNGQLLFLPRQKVVYLVDDTMTDSPEGLGLFRHLVDPAERLRRYLLMEGLGYERDLRGLPVGRAPLAELDRQVRAGTITDDQRKRSIEGIRKFLTLEAKQEDSSLLLDSATYLGPTADGFQVSPELKYGMELLTAGATGFHDISMAIDRVTHDMARIIGVESLLLGGQGGGSGSKSLSEDKSRNLYLSVDASVKDIAEGFRRDMLGMVWALNGLDPKLMPQLHTEDVAFKDVASITKSLADMAAAGAVLSPDDTVINDIRDMMGVSKQPDGSFAAAVAAAMLPRVQLPKGGAVAPAPDVPETGPDGKPVDTLGDKTAQTPSGKAPHAPGPTPQPPGSPEGGKGRRNRTSSSTIK
ncbi:MAG TPA: hypothetical protein VIJ94_06400 [Caulobacteraceae bacterium]